MKRPQKALVFYSSSDDSEPELSEPPPPKKKKLPPLSASLRPPIPIDNPALHQGRIRSSPHVEGQFAAYVYVPVFVGAQSALGILLDEVARDAKELVPGLWDVGFLGGHAEDKEDIESGGTAERKKGERELHVSLSRPTYLRAHQREELKRAVKTLAEGHAPFKASFAAFSELTNDERTRKFLTLEVGAGHSELCTLSESLTPTLHSFRQKEFYTDPRFHASIAWVLLERPIYSPSGSKSIPESLSVHRTAQDGRSIENQSTHRSRNQLNGISSVDEPHTLRDPTPSSSTHSQEPKSDVATIPTDSQKEFLTIPHFPADLIPTLTAKHSAKLIRVNVGMFDVGEVRVKIGKWVGGWALQG